MHLTTFEYSYLFKNTDIPVRCFDWLVGESLKAISVTVHKGQLCLKTNHYVGMISTPFGTQIEILPKIFIQTTTTNKGYEPTNTITKTRQWFYDLLIKQFLQQCIHEKSLTTGKIATTANENSTVVHWLLPFFLNQCQQLLHHGLTTDYHTEQQNERFLSGKLNIADNTRDNHSKFKHHQFSQHNDKRVHDTAENRIMCFALLASQQFANIDTHESQANQLYQRFLHQLAQSPLSQAMPLSHYLRQDYKTDITLIQRKRLPPIYQQAIATARLVLDNLSCIVDNKKQHGLSLLFNMNRLFETMIEGALARNVSSNQRVLVQPKHKYVLENNENNKKSLGQSQTFFALQPDFMVVSVEGDNEVASTAPCRIIDAKWKLVNSDTLNINQSDVYQMFTYASHYFDVNSSLASPEFSDKSVWLVYPKTATFYNSISFSFRQLTGVTLKIIPFDVHKQVFCVD